MNKIFGERLEKIRTSKHLKQKDVCLETGILQARYSKLENGTIEPDLDTLIKLSNFYKVSVDYLLGLSDVTNSFPLLDKVNKLSEHNRNLIIGIIESMN